MERYAVRRAVDHLVRGACLLATLLALVPLVSLIYFVVSRGLGGLDLAFFSELPRPVGEPGGGLSQAILGTLSLVALACLFGIPPGVLAGIYLAEHGETRLGRFARFAADVLAGTPSITVGLFVYAVVVLGTGSFSGLAGGVALAILMLPTVARSTEELLRLVPESLREAALGLGAAGWRTSLAVIVRTAAPGIAVGVMLAVARIAGETAPLLFTAFNSRFFSDPLAHPTASLPVSIYTYAISPYPDWHEKAWAAALVLLLFVVALNLLARLLVRYRVRSS